MVFDVIVVGGGFRSGKPSRERIVARWSDG